MSKQKLLTKDEMMAYELVERMKLSASGYIGPSPYWHGWALRDAYLEGCKNISDNSLHDKEVMRQAADRINELQHELARLQQGNTLTKEHYQIALNDKTIQSDVLESELAHTQANLKTVTQMLANSLPIALPDTIAQHAAVNALRGMSPQEALEWISDAWERRYRENQEALQRVQG